ncbi:TRAP transporter small permease [Pseudooceanicola nitratireducens]|uniref:TRAP transporter small permease n=1 Tax=Pseudooceanicola nitratireducens TaxID=517719 RepID=UPI001C977064|nr:TRAP transporter small permease [Pseudooceanicola nitratireducens]MBY6167513.1 TRAP transporter small permease [Pseudooceanicola nitratireducens]
MTFIVSLSRMAGILGACLLAATGAMLTYEVIARYFFLKPTIWAAELSQLCLIWGCLLAMGWVLSLRQHITVNAVTNLLPPAAQRICVLLSLCVIIVFSVVVTIWGWDIFHESFVRGRTTGSLLNLPAWVAELSVPVGFALLTAQALVELIRLRTAHVASLGSSHE